MTGRCRPRRLRASLPPIEASPDRISGPSATQCTGWRLTELEPKGVHPGHRFIEPARGAGIGASEQQNPFLVACLATASRRSPLPHPPVSTSCPAILTLLAPRRDQNVAAGLACPGRERGLRRSGDHRRDAIRGSFHGTQYHPEHTLAVSAALIELRATELVEENFGTEPSQIVAIAADYRALDAEPTRRDLIWRYGIASEIMDPLRRTTEIRQLAANRRRTSSVLSLAAPASPLRGGQIFPRRLQRQQIDQEEVVVYSAAVHC
jgi:hypothetical protein